MTKEQFKKFIDANKGRLIHIITDNLEHFWLNAQDSFLGWDDDSETCICIRPAISYQLTNMNETPWELVQFRYDDIQYMISYMNGNDVIEIVKQWNYMFDNDNAILTTPDEVIKAIKESHVNYISSATGFQEMSAERKKEYEASMKLPAFIVSDK